MGARLHVDGARFPCGLHAGLPLGATLVLELGAFHVSMVQLSKGLVVSQGVICWLGWIADDP